MGCSRWIIHEPPQRLPDRGPIECTAHSPGPTVDIALGIATAVASVAATYWVVATPWDSVPRNGVIPAFHQVPFPFVVTGLGVMVVVPLAFFGSAREGENALERCRDVPDRRERNEQARRAASDAARDAEARRGAETRQLRALELAAAGAAAARRGDCTTAIAIGQRIRAIDPATLDDYDIAACRTGSD